MAIRAIVAVGIKDAGSHNHTHIPKFIAYPRPLIRMRKSALSQRLTMDHLNRGKATWARLASARPKMALIHEYFQDRRGTSSFPLKLLASSSACPKISSLS